MATQLYPCDAGVCSVGHARNGAVLALRLVFWVVRVRSSQSFLEGVEGSIAYSFGKIFDFRHASIACFKVSLCARSNADLLCGKLCFSASGSLCCALVTPKLCCILVLCIRPLIPHNSFVSQGPVNDNVASCVL